MSSSPYISEELKTYLKRFKIEELINGCVNSVAREMPTDPYSTIAQMFEKHASQDIQILTVSATEILSVENMPVLSITVKVNYMSKEFNFRLPYVLGIAGDANMLFDEDRLNGKGQNKGIVFLKKLEAGLTGRFCSQQVEIDKFLLKEYELNEKKGLYQINICSYLPCLVQSHLLNKPLYKCFAQLAEQESKEVNEINVVVNCLQGSKIVGSKCKAFKFLLIGQKLNDPYQISIVVQAIRKAIVSGKGGEAALKLHSDGTFICPADTIADNLKIVEDAIVSTNNKDRFTIGISWFADNFFMPDQKKYQLENPKALLDIDQLIDYYFKLATDKPIITYYEDPVFCDDQTAWLKLITKFKDSKVRIGSRKLYNSVETIKKFALSVNKDDMPEMDETAIVDANSKRIHLNMHFYRPFELETLSKLLAIKKNLKSIKTILLLSDNNYETHDTTLVDLCVGLGAYIVLGTVAKFDRISKLNRMKELLG